MTVPKKKTEVMPVSILATTRLSTKGQIVIPKSVRERLGLRPGTEFVVVAERSAILIRVISQPRGERLDLLLTEAEKAARRIQIMRVARPSARTRKRKGSGR